MRTPWLGWLVGITRRKKQPKQMSLDAAMILLAGRMNPSDSFCVHEEVWRFGHSPTPGKPTYQVTLFRGQSIASQRSGNLLEEVLKLALADYEQ